MNKLILIVCSLLFFSCKKDKGVTVPQPLINGFSQECSNDCKPQLYRVELNGVDYIGLSYVPGGCDSGKAKRFFHKEGGTEIYYIEQRYNELYTSGRFVELLWSCN